MLKLQRIERRILVIKHEINGKAREIVNRYPYAILRSELDRQVAGENRPLHAELDELETQRRFLIDRRESWLPKTIWMVLVPIVVSLIISIAAPYLLNYLGIKAGQ